MDAVYDLCNQHAQNGVQQTVESKQIGVGISDMVHCYREKDNSREVGRIRNVQKNC